MRIRDLRLEPAIADHFESEGIAELYPPQAAAVDAGVCEGASVLAAVPTASGKTLIAQLAALTADGPAVYVVPLRALATEKAATFEAVPGIEVAVATGDFDATDESLAEADVVVATAEKVDAAIRHGAAWVEAVACAVLDEVHLLDAAERGPTLEVTIAKLRRLNPDLQLVALSATVPNAGEVGEWLDATVVESDWRPVELKAGVYAGGSLALDGEIERSVDPGELSATAALVADALADGGQCLVFVSSRRGARDLAGELALAVDPASARLGDGAETGTDADATDTGDETETGDEDHIDDEPAHVADAIADTAETRTGEALADLAADGVAFHHAGLRSEHRSLVEDGFRAGQLSVLCATPTLAAGVNVPARRVVVRDHERYTDAGYEPLSTLEVRQMFGRAGRPGLDPYGEAVLIAEDADEQADLRERYLESSPDPVTSELDDPRALRAHVLAAIASGLADSRAELQSLLEETFCAHQGGGGSLHATAADAIDRLTEAGMLEAPTAAVDAENPVPTPGSGDDDATGLEATELGALVSRVYVDPGTGADVVTALDRAADLERITPLTVCEIVCDTAEMPTRYVTQTEAGRLSEIALQRADELARPIQDFEGDFQTWLRSLKTAKLLADFAEGVPLEELVDGYDVGPGDVRRYAERAEWLLSATESLAEHVDSPAVEQIRETRERLAERTG